MVQLSKQYLCNFDDEMQDEIRVLKIITNILSHQASALHEQVEEGEIEIDQPEEGRTTQRRRTGDFEDEVMGGPSSDE